MVAYHGIIVQRQLRVLAHGLALRINDDLLIRGLHVYGLGQIVDALETAVGQQQTTPLRPIQHFRGLQIGRQQEHAFAFVAVTSHLHVEGAVGELINGSDVFILA